MTTILTNQVFSVQKWEDTEMASKAASTTFVPNQFISYGSAGVVPSTPGVAILGVGQSSVDPSDVDYASQRKIPYQVALGYTFRLPVTTGSATQAMEGYPFDLDTAGSLNVSTPGTQVRITRVIASDLVEVSVIKLAAFN